MFRFRICFVQQRTRLVLFRVVNFTGFTQKVLQTMILATGKWLAVVKILSSRLCNHGTSVSRKFCSTVKFPSNKLSEVQVPAYLTLHGQWPQEDRQHFVADMTVLEDFISEEEEHTLLQEIEPYLKRMRYEFDHWDDAIHGYRETERKHWYPANRAVFDRVKEVAFKGETLPYIHVLDLAKEGVIKPHVDSVRYCGSTIAGISLLSDSVMRLVRTNDEEQTNAEYRQIFAANRDDKYWSDIFLARRSLYIMKDTARYKYTHEILAGEDSVFSERKVDKDRRISIICRNDP